MDNEMPVLGPRALQRPQHRVCARDNVSDAVPHDLIEYLARESGVP